MIIAKYIIVNLHGYINIGRRSIIDIYHDLRQWNYFIHIVLEGSIVYRIVLAVEGFLDVVDEVSCVKAKSVLDLLH